MPKCPSVSNREWLGIHALEIISMTQSSFPCHRAWLVSSGTTLAPRTSTSWPYAFCLLSQPYLALLPLTLTLALSHDPKSFPVRPQASPGPPPWPRVSLSGQECCCHHDECSCSAVSALGIKRGAWNAAEAWQLNEHATTRPHWKVASFVESAPHLLVPGYFVLLVVLVHPKVLSTFSGLPFLNLLTIKKQMTDDSVKVNPQFPALGTSDCISWFRLGSYVNSSASAPCPPSEVVSSSYSHITVGDTNTICTYLVCCLSTTSCPQNLSSMKAGTL